MPKMKSKGAVKNRFRVTKTGKVKGSRPARGHMHAIRNGKSRRGLRKPLILDATWSKLVRNMLGGRV